MSPPPAARRAVVMVWDGMRPDLISPELTPHLARLAETGVRCLDSHAIFPTVTRVNAASLATGTLPARHGIVGNSLYAPKVDPRAAISIGDHRSLYALIETRGGRLLPCDSLADRVAAAGGRTVVVSTGSPGSAFLCHPRAAEVPGDRIYNPAIMVPESGREELERRFGPIPETEIPDTARNGYFNRVAVEYVLPELDPTLLVYWHDDPDKTQHHRGFGSPEALAAIRQADDNLGRLLAALAASGRLADTALAVVSDHGYVWTEPIVDAAEPFEAAGLGAALAAGEIVLSRNGCAILVNAPGADEALLDRLAELLRAWEHGGLLFSGAHGRPPLAGTLPLAAIGIGGELAPDLLCALAWDDATNGHGHAGRSAGLDRQYLATHGGLSPWEVRNTLLLAGAGLKSGLADPLPSGNLDLAPTLLHLLGLDPPPDLHGRILHEALRDGPAPETVAVTRETLSADYGAARQTIRISRVGTTRYLDYGWIEAG